MGDEQDRRETVALMIRRAFTLIELVLVFAFIGLLAGVAYFVIRPSADSVSATGGSSSLDLVIAAQEAHYLTYGTFAAASELELSGVTPVEGPAENGEVSVYIQETNGVESVGVAAVIGNQCITKAITADPQKAAVTGSYNASDVVCDGELALGGVA